MADTTTSSSDFRSRTPSILSSEASPRRSSRSLSRSPTRHTSFSAVGSSNASESSDRAPRNVTDLSKDTASSASRKRRLRKNSFRSRSSPLDYETLDREQNPMRGFFVLFWVSMVAYVVVTAYSNWKNHRMIVSLRFFFYFSDNAVSLVIADGLMVCTMTCAVGIVKMIEWGWIPVSAARAIQHVWQSVWFGACVVVMFLPGWPWTQSGFFAMHSIAMLLKMHSYIAYNIELFHKLDRLNTLRRVTGVSKKNDDHDTQPESDDCHDEMMMEMRDLEKELVKPTVSFPNNITVYNFIDYLLVPTLVYEIEYPRTDRFRPLYFIEKVLATMCTFGLLYLSYEHYIYPVLIEMPNHSFSDSLIQLLIPFMVCFLLIFYIIFECICNAFAELTCFADREFYSDWWNSTTFDEYARKWNKPVHEFLLRHIYLESISTYKLSRNDATFLTFFLSSCLHELVMLVVGRRLRLYFFCLQMIQIPLIYVARVPVIRKQKLLGNIVFWVSMFLGPPLLAVVYLREHYA